MIPIKQFLFHQGGSKRSSVERETWKAGDFCVKDHKVISSGILKKKLFELKAGSDLPTCVQSCYVASQHSGDESNRRPSDDGEIVLQHQWPATNNLWNDILSST